ncbi:unnamed protein product [Owenia fusiformis]|uniref:Uncharacterized protein n=1 Tax=Owenia fusiformis TaxID=6347 RepID=A0A8J1XYQ5_OWEFU|nr:unnamed protein product [Owenia fusiformis]
MPWFHAFESGVSVVIDTKYCMRGLRLTSFMLVSGEVEQLFILIDESESRKKSVFLSTYSMLSCMSHIRQSFINIKVTNLSKYSYCDVIIINDLQLLVFFKVALNCFTHFRHGRD